MADGVWKGVYTRQVYLNKFFDPSTPSMRKVDNGGKKENKNQLGVPHSEVQVELDCQFNIAIWILPDFPW